MITGHASIWNPEAVAMKNRPGSALVALNIKGTSNMEDYPWAGNFGMIASH